LLVVALAHPANKTFTSRKRKRRKLRRRLRFRLVSSSFFPSILKPVIICINSDELLQSAKKVTFILILSIFLILSRDPNYEGMPLEVGMGIV